VTVLIPGLSQRLARGTIGVFFSCHGIGGSASHYNVDHADRNRASGCMEQWHEILSMPLCLAQLYHLSWLHYRVSPHN
jgi:hypothetical protein